MLNFTNPGTGQNKKKAEEIGQFVPVFGEFGWVQLFNGKDLSGWKVEPGQWKIQGGDMVGLNTHSVATTARRFAPDFHFAAEVKLAGGRAQIQFRNGRRVDFSADRDRVEVSLRLGNLEAQKFELVPNAWDKWITIEVVAEGGRVDVLVNSQKVLFKFESLPFDHVTDWSGPIGLATPHVGPEVRFRNIEIKELPPPDDGAALVKTEKAKLQGVWQLVAEGHDGIAPAEPRPGLKGLRFHFKGDEFKTTVVNEPGIKGSFSINPGQKPATLDWTDASEGTKTLAIYRWNGDDNLIICGSDEERPTDFTTKARDNRSVLVFERIITDSSTSKPAEPAWVQLFNGKDLSGWDEKETKKRWKVVDES